MVKSVLIVPIIVWPGCRDGYVAPKESLFACVAWILLLTWLWRHMADGDLGAGWRRLRRRPVALPLAAYVLTSVASLGLGSVEYVPLRACVLGAASLVFLFILLERLEDNEALAGWIAGAYLLAMTIAAGIVLWQDRHPDAAALEGMRASLTGARPDWRFGLVGTAGNPNFAASGFIIALPLALMGGVLAVRRRWVFVIVSLVVAAALLATFSTAGMAGAALAVVALGFWLRRARVPYTRVLPAALGLLAVVAFYLAPNPANARGESYLSAAMRSPLWKHGYQPRLFIWRTSAFMIVEHPICGVGYGGYFPEHQKYQGLHYRLRGTPHELPRVGLVDYAHSVPIQRAAETGLLGLVALTWVVLVVGRRWAATWRADEIKRVSGGRAGTRRPLDTRPEVTTRCNAGNASGRYSRTRFFSFRDYFLEGGSSWLRAGAGCGLLAAGVQALPDSPFYTLVGRMGMLVCAALVLYEPERAPRRFAPQAWSFGLRAALLLVWIAAGIVGTYRLAYPILAERAAARLDYAAAVRYARQEPFFRYGYAGVLAARGQWARARGELQYAYRLLPDAEFAAAWERASLAMGDTGGAIAARRAMLAVNPCYGPWYLPLAELLEASGDLSGAGEARRLAHRFTLPSP
ncbi:O-antigen ligase family protein [bacterium]|nr:O-antigen ligase family protein [bacterium]